jgi:hypothetical protein
MASNCNNCGIAVPVGYATGDFLDRPPCPICQSKSRNYTLYSTPLARETHARFADSFTHSRFFGRDKELHELTNFLLRERSPAVSIVGTFGSGKTWFVSRFLSTRHDLQWSWLDLSILRMSGNAIEDLLEDFRANKLNHSRERIVVLENVDILTDDIISDFLNKLYNWKAVRGIILTSIRPLNVPRIHKISLDQWTPIYSKEPATGIAFNIEEPEADEKVIRVVRPEIILLNNTLIRNLKKS